MGTGSTMNPSDQQNQQQYPGQGAPQNGALPQQNIPPQQIPGTQGALYVDPNQASQYQAPSQQVDPRANFMPDMQPGVLIPGDPHAPVVQNGQKPKVNVNSTQNNLEIAEIRDGIVIMNDGSFRSVVMVKSINFDLMSPQEREAVEYSYQGFLNSLYFPIQIFVRSQKVDLQNYIDKLDKIRSEHDNMLLALLMEDYINYIDQISSQTNIMDKNFYVVIPYLPHIDSTKPLAQTKGLFDGVVNLFGSNKTHVVINEKNLNDAKDELRNRVQSVLAGLLQCGIQGLPLDTQELIELYYDTYNPDTATRQKLKNFDDLQVPVVTKGEGSARQPNLERELQ